MRKIAYPCLALSISFFAYAGGEHENAHLGGNPEFVHMPDNYKTKFTVYDTRNRQNGKQVAVLYANKIALTTASQAKLGDGSQIIMEIYKTVPDEHGNPIADEHGLFKKGKFAAIAVMEKRSLWSTQFDAKARTGDWAYAIYKADGSKKENDLDCAGCHTPFPEQDYLFSHSSLVNFAK